MSDLSERVVAVEINGQRYAIRSALDPAYINELANYVDFKMRLAGNEAPSADSLRLAVLAALNIADEFFRWRRTGAGSGALLERAIRIEQIVDRALEQVGPAA